MKKIGLLLFFLSFLLLPDKIFTKNLMAEMQEGVSARSLFMSTSGSEIQYRAQEEKVKKTSPTSKKQTNNKENKENIKPHLGMSVQVYAVKGGNIIPVNYKTYVFHTGDKFKVKVSYNTPGVVEFINLDPKGQVNYLGRYVIEEPFVATMLPKDGSFIFTDPKGVEKLIINFYPCAVKDTQRAKEINLASGRSIGIVKEFENQPTLVNVKLPDCNFEGGEYQSKPELHLARASGRGIIVVEEVKEKRTYFFVSEDNYRSNQEPITAVIELQHK